MTIADLIEYLSNKPTSPYYSRGIEGGAFRVPINTTNEVNPLTDVVHPEETLEEKRRRYLEGKKQPAVVIPPLKNYKPNGY